MRKGLVPLLALVLVGTTASAAPLTSGATAPLPGCPGSVETDAAVDALACDPDGAGFDALSASGETARTSPPSTSWDASSPPSAGPRLRTGARQRLADEPAVQRAAEATGGRARLASAPVGAETVAAAPVEVSDRAVVATLGDMLLTDPDTVRPVSVDPGVSASLQQDATAGSAYAEGVGLCSTADAAGSSCGDTVTTQLRPFPWRGGTRAETKHGPYPPAGLRTENPRTACVMGEGRPFMRSETPTLVATLAHPDGTSLYGRFDVFDVIDGAARGVVWTGSTAPQGSGAEHKVTVNAEVLRDGHTYRWRALAFDARSGVGISTVPCELTVDLVAPDSPSITPVQGQPGVYDKDVAGGGIGLTGQFTLSPGSSSDVVAYKYSFDGDAMDQTAAVSLGGSATISYTPTTAGPHVLYVESVDRAGNTSPTPIHRFIVR
ncbi:hypothetical protein [Cellulomonas sp. URHB0016]